MAAVRWTGFLAILVSGLSNFRPSTYLPLDLTPVAGSALSRQESQRTVTGSLELPVRHDVRCAVVSVEVVKKFDEEYHGWNLAVVALLTDLGLALCPSRLPVLAGQQHPASLE
jgi:hypothetical protein